MILGRPALLRLFVFPLALKIFLTSLILTLLMEILILLEQAEDILKIHLGIPGLIRFSLYHFPALFLQTLPVAVLVGSIFALFQMASSSEIAVLRAGGLTPWRLFFFLAPAPVLFGVLGAVLQLSLAPQAEQDFNRWWNIAQTRAGDQGQTPGIWKWE